MKNFVLSRPTAEKGFETIAIRDARSCGTVIVVFFVDKVEGVWDFLAPSCRRSSIIFFFFFFLFILALYNDRTTIEHFSSTWSNRIIFTDNFFPFFFFFCRITRSNPSLIQVNGNCFHSGQCNVDLSSLKRVIVHIFFFILFYYIRVYDGSKNRADIWQTHMYRHLIIILRN